MLQLILLIFLTYTVTVSRQCPLLKVSFYRSPPPQKKGGVEGTGRQLNFSLKIYFDADKAMGCHRVAGPYGQTELCSPGSEPVSPIPPIKEG